VSGNLTPGASGNDHEINIDAIEVKGPIAMATCTERGFLGHDFAEYFTLLKTDSGWKITNKSYAAV